MQVPNRAHIPPSTDDLSSPWTPEALHEAALNIEYLAPSASHVANPSDSNRNYDQYLKSHSIQEIVDGKYFAAQPDHNGSGPLQSNLAVSMRVFTETSAPAPDHAENEADKTDEIAKEALDALKPGNLLFSQIGFFEMLDSHYPGFGEILDAISSSVTGAVFDDARDWVVKQVTAKWAVDGQVSVSQIQELVKEKVSTLHLDFRRFTSSWAPVTAAKLSGYREQVGLARTRLLKVTLDQERDQTEKSARATQEDAKLLDAAGIAIRSDDLGKTAESLEDFTRELAALGDSWPPLTEPDKSQLAELSAILERIRRSDLANSEGNSSKGINGPGASAVLIIAAQSPIALALHLNPDWQSPLEGISALHRFCRAKTLLVVATSLSSGADSAALKRAMGNKYDSASNVWQSEVRRQAEVQAAIERAKHPNPIEIPHDPDKETVDIHPVEGMP